MEIKEQFDELVFEIASIRETFLSYDNKTLSVSDVEEIIRLINLYVEKLDAANKMFSENKKLLPKLCFSNLKKIFRVQKFIKSNNIPIEIDWFKELKN